MTRAIAAALLAALAVSAPAVRAAPADDAAQARYQSLLAAAKADPASADWAALRLAYAATPGFEVMGDHVAREAILKALTAGDWQGALDLAQKRISADFVDEDAHIFAAYALDKLGRNADAVAEHNIAYRLLKSIETGDGLSAATAFTPIDVDEEYSLMKVQGRQVTSQALVQANGHSYDLLTTVGQDGRTQQVYFLVDRVLAAEAALLAPGGKP